MLLDNEIKKNEDELVEVTEEVETQQEEVVATPKKKRAKRKPKTEVPAEVESDELDLTDKIEEWKRVYKRVFKNEIDGEIIIWRRLKRGEYKEILKLEEEDEDNKILTKQERMVKTAMLYPFNADEIISENAGLATVLSEEILARSGFAMSYTEEL